jgi:hypothetical protein
MGEVRGCAGSRGDTRGGGTKGDDAAPKAEAERRSFVPPRGFVECIHRRATAVRRGGVDPRAGARARTMSRSFPNSEHWSNFLAKRPSSSSHTKLRRYATRERRTSEKACARDTPARTTRA